MVKILISQNSEQLSADRNRAKSQLISLDVGGGFDMELSHRSHFDIFEMLMMNDWTLTNERNTSSEITAVTTSEFTVSSGTAFAANDIVRGSGFANDANNAVFTLTGGSATSAEATGMVCRNANRTNS